MGSIHEGKNKITTIYSEDIKALYGTMDAVKLFYDSLLEVLTKELGFTINSYDASVVDI